MFFKLAAFELRYFLRQPSFYVCLLVFFLLPFFAMVSDNVTIGGASNVNFNAPHAISQTMLVMSFIAMFLVANFVGGTAVRDISSKMEGISLSLPVNKFNYLWGRLLGSYLFCLLVFLCVPLGTLAGSFWPGIDAERLGATQLLPYVWTYSIFVIPNLLFSAILFYVVALKTRSMMGVYLSAVAFIVFYELTQTLVDNPDYKSIAELLDPFGFGAFFSTTRYWTPFEMNTQVIPLNRDILSNRLLWLAISLAIGIAAHFWIDLRKQPKARKPKVGTSPPPHQLYLAKPQISGFTLWQGFWLRVRFEVTQVIKSAPFIVLCLISVFSLSTILLQSTGPFGTPNWPLTRFMANYVVGAFSLMVLIIVTYYSGETVWRERQLGIGDMIETTPIKNWMIYLPKIIALWVVVISLMLVGGAFTLIYQLFKGYTHLELDVYIGIISFEIIFPVMRMVVLAVFIQVLSPNKFIGMILFVLFFIFLRVATELGLEHSLWRFNSSSPLVYSDINGYGHLMTGVIWYHIYWSALALVLMVLGYALWRRGTEYNLQYRLRKFTRNMGWKGAFALVVGLTVFVSAGSHIFYNTRVLNDFITSDQGLDRAEEYEHKYKAFESLPVPSITDVYAEVNFYPEQRKLLASGHYLIENRNEQPLTRVLLKWPSGKHRQTSVKVEGGNEVERDERHGHSWIEFDPPLAPGSGTRMDFEYSRDNPGFKDRGLDFRMVENGAFLNNMEIFPGFGYNKGREIDDRHERRKRDLPPPERLPKLEDNTYYGTNFIGEDADFINFETVISTSEKQFAIAPGYLQKEWTKDGRHYFHYKMDAPIFNFFAFLSADLALTKDSHKGVKIEVYHHPNHDFNVARMIESVKDSLDYFSAQFSPYQHRQVRIIEFPRYAGFAQSFSNTVPYSEDLGFIADLRDPEDIDYVYFVTAHEMAHQWWGHQITPANVQGSAVLSETLAEYSAYMVMEKTLGKDRLRKFLKWEMDRYLNGRSSEILEEMPLYRAENQQYIHYQKGGVVMYALRDRFGEEVINTALRNFLQAYQYAYDPYPTTLDLLSFLKAEVGEEGYEFIDDLFTKITLFDLRVKTATAKALDNGRYEVTLDLEANKYYADGQGEETLVEFSDRFDIGIFAEDPDKAAAGSDHVLHLQKHAIHTGENHVVIEVDALPKYAGLDPYIKMIDRDSDDNLTRVELIE